MTAALAAPRTADRGLAPHRDYVTVSIADQWFGIPVEAVHDVLGAQTIARVPLAPLDVAGSLNLRGHIVTAIDPRIRLRLPPREDQAPRMSVVVEHGNDFFSLLIDSVGEVLSLPEDRFEPNPVTLDARWREVSAGVFRLDDRLLVVLDVAQMLAFDRLTEA